MWFPFNTASLAEEMHNSPEHWAVLQRDIRVSTELGPSFPNSQMMPCRPLAGLVQEQMVQQEELASSGGQGLQQAGEKKKKGNVNLGTQKIP